MLNVPQTYPRMYLINKYRSICLALKSVYVL